MLTGATCLSTCLTSPYSTCLMLPVSPFLSHFLWLIFLTSPSVSSPKPYLPYVTFFAAYYLAFVFCFIFPSSPSTPHSIFFFFLCILCLIFLTSLSTLHITCPSSFLPHLLYVIFLISPVPYITCLSFPTSPIPQLT